MSDFIEEYVLEKKIPGLAVGVLSEGELVFKKGYGYRDIENKSPIQTHTPFIIASISKTITAVASMILYDSDKFDLDDPINEYLPFKVIHPKYSDTEITFKMLHTHTSGIIDDHLWKLDRNMMYVRGNVIPELSLQEILKRMLVPGEKHYNEKGTFSQIEPGSKFVYSNVGSALLGYLVECIAEQPFDEFCKEKIFKPLGMKNTSWRIKDFDLDSLAFPYYEYNKTKGHYTSPDYPNGMLRTGVEDLSKFLLMFVNDGTYEDVTILEEETVQLMKKVHFEYEEDGEECQIGLTWYFEESDDEAVSIGHEGAEEGVTTKMFYCEEEEEELVFMLCNLTNADLDPIEEYIYDNMDKFT